MIFTFRPIKFIDALPPCPKEFQKVRPVSKPSQKPSKSIIDDKKRHNKEKTKEKVKKSLNEVEAFKKPRSAETPKSNIKARLGKKPTETKSYWDIDPKDIQVVVDSNNRQLPVDHQKEPREEIGFMSETYAEHRAFNKVKSFVEEEREKSHQLLSKLTDALIQANARPVIINVNTSNNQRGRINKKQRPGKNERALIAQQQKLIKENPLNQ